MVFNVRNGSNDVAAWLEGRIRKRMGSPLRVPVVFSILPTAILPTTTWAVVASLAELIGCRRSLPGEAMRVRRA